MLADLVQEQRAPARPRRSRPSRRRSAPVNAPFSWPNSSLSSRLSGTAAQFTATNGPPAPAARPVDRPGDELLAGAALAQQQHGGVALGDRADLAHGLLHDPRAPQDSVQPLLPLDLRAQPLVLAAQPVVVERSTHGHGDLGQLEGLRQVVIGALAHGLDRGLERAERGHQDDARRGPAPPGRRRAPRAPDLSMTRSVTTTSNSWDASASNAAWPPVAATTACPRARDGAPAWPSCPHRRRRPRTRRLLTPAPRTRGARP